MEKLLIKGEKTIISRIKDPPQQMVFEFVYPRSIDVLYDIDIFIVLMDEKGRVSKEDIIFYGNSNLDSKGIVYEEFYELIKVEKTLKLTLSKVPDSIQTISLVYSVYCKDKDKLERPMYTKVKMNAINKTLRSHMFASEDKLDLVNDQVLILGEIYKHRDIWKYNAVKQNMDDEIMVVLKKLYNLTVY